MNVFPQALLSGHGVPKELRPTLVKYSGDLSRELKAMLRSRKGTVKAVGISILLTVEGDLEAIAFATAENINNVVLFFPRRSEDDVWKRAIADCSVLAALFKSHSRGPTIFGFGMTRIALHLRGNLDISEVRGIELLPYGEWEASPGKLVKDHVNPSADTFSVNSVWDPTTEDTKDDPIRLQRLCLRAWLSVVLGSRLNSTGRIADFSKVDVSLLSPKHFGVLYKLIREVEQIGSAYSITRDCDFSQVEEGKDGGLVVHNERYKTRIRASENTQIRLTDEDGRVLRGRAKNTEGRRTVVARTSGSGAVAGVHRIQVVGREDAGHAERSRDAFIYDLLRGKRHLDDPSYELIHLLYFPQDDVMEQWPAKVETAKVKGQLNASQAIVVKAMTDAQPPIIIVRGPPGTGKTTTISAAVHEWITDRSSAWLVAQSNVAVKNMAERLSKDNINYKILVSREFYDEWHEHLYGTQVQSSLFRTDEIPTDAQELEKLFGSVHVVLCTLSTLANPVILRRNVFAFVPVSHLVIDEASQIGIVNYMHILAQHKKLRKVCFFGDPAQLPPYGKDVAPTLQSIFEVKHFKRHAYFLNIQYRMPETMGSFISENVYHKKLSSQHEVTAPSCVAFIDVSKGEEKMKGKSYCNMSEVQTIVDLVRRYYGKKNYCIITPYDAQRSEIEGRLKSEGLKWDNVYNVDSFQGTYFPNLPVILSFDEARSKGNEADYILLSVVRTSSPGFLISRNRVNVMLTRFRRGMVIVTKRRFMDLWNVRETLVGKLVEHWEKICGSECWKDWKAVTEVKTDLPGCPPRSLVVRTNVAFSTSTSTISRQSGTSHSSGSRVLSVNSSETSPRPTPSSSSISPSTKRSYASSVSSAPPSANSSRKSHLLASDSGPKAWVELPITQRSKTKAGPKTRALPYSALFPELSSSPNSVPEEKSDPESSDVPTYDSLATRAPTRPWGALALNARNGALRRSATVQSGHLPSILAENGEHISSNLKETERVRFRSTGANRPWDNYDDAFPDAIPEPEANYNRDAATGQWGNGPPLVHPILIRSVPPPSQMRMAYRGVPQNAFVDAIWPMDLLRPARP